MTEEHDVYRDWAAAYVLDALEPSERIDYQRHLRRCAQCQVNVNEFSFFPDSLTRFETLPDFDRTVATKRVTPPEVTDVSHEFRRLRTVGLRWRVAALVISAAILILIATLGVRATSQPVALAGTPLEFDDTVTTGSVIADARIWGTSIDVDLENLPRRATYQLWAIDTAGVWSNAATWGATPTGSVTLTGSTAIETTDIARVVVTSSDRNDVLLDATS